MCSYKLRSFLVMKILYFPATLNNPKNGGHMFKKHVNSLPKITFYRSISLPLNEVQIYSAVNLISPHQLLISVLPVTSLSFISNRSLFDPPFRAGLNGPIGQSDPSIRIPANQSSSCRVRPMTVSFESSARNFPSL